MSEDYIWFKEHYVEFQQKYGNAFLAIKNKQVLGVYNTYAEGVRNTAIVEERGTFIIQECKQDSIAYYCSIASTNF